MALKGTLGDFSLSDILQLIGLQRKTGVLVLSRDDVQVSIGFEGGRVVHAESSDRTIEQRVGQLLVRIGKLTEARLDHALEIQQQTLQRIGQVLVERGWTDRESLQRQLRLQVSETIFELFRWQDGEYDFRPDAEVDYDRQLMTPIPCEQLIMEGAQMADEWPHIERVIPSRLVVLRLTAEAHQRLATSSSESSEVKGSVYEDDIDFGFIPSDPLDEPERGGPGLEATQLQVLRWIDGRRSALEVAELSELGTFDAFKMMAELMDQRLVELAPRDEDGDVHAPRRGLLETALPGRLLAAVIAVAATAGMVVAGADLSRIISPEVPIGSPPETLSAPTVMTGALGLDRTRAAASRARLARIDRALRTFYLANRAWPATLDELGYQGLIPEDLLQDPWGRPYTYTIRNWGYRLEALPHPLPVPPIEHRFSTLERSAHLPSRAAAETP
jgi:hypothetical protein